MGTGKSSLGNCLLGQNNFEAKRSARAVTAKLTVGSTCASLRDQMRHQQSQQQQERPLVVVDSPGFGDPSRSTTALLHEIKVRLSRTHEALHAHEFQAIV